MSFSGFVLTDKGAALLAKAQTGTKITFSRAQIGTGYLPEDTVITQTTALYGTAIDVPISGLSTANKQATIAVQISNASFSTEFVFREIGVFAIDPTEGEILYLYGNAGENAEPIPAKSVPNEFLFNLITKIGNATDITVNVDNGIMYASKADLLAMEGQLKNAEVIEEISDSSFIPVVDSTDEGKTKKISWNKLKSLLGGIMTFATESQAEEGTDNSTVMTPLRVFQAISKWISNQTISTLNTTSKTIPGAVNELKEDKADSLYYNNGQLQLRSGQSNVGLPVSIATGDTIHAFVCGHDNFSVTLENASNTFTIPESMGYDTSKVVHLFHNDVPLIRGKHYAISNVGVVTLAFTAEAGDVFDGEIEHTSFEAEDLHGVLPVASGGTGADNIEDAVKKLKILLPETKTVLGLSETATPDDAFNALFNKIATENMENLVIQPIGTSQTWSAPKAVGQLFKVFCVGGGGGGGGFDNNNTSTHAGGGGGGGGYIEIETLKIEQGTVIDIVCGAGGSGSPGEASPKDGEHGGDTLFGNLLIANGGEGGGACSQKSYHDGYGGKGGNGSSGGGGGRGGGMGVGYPSVAGDGGNGTLCGGGGAGCTTCQNSIIPTIGNGGTGGIYGGHGGDASERIRVPKVFGGRILDILFQLDKLTNGLLHMRSAEMSDSIEGYGAGGIGGAGGTNAIGSNTKNGEYLTSCGGGGGYCGNGGSFKANNTAVGGGGGGGGYCGNGGDGYTGGGGGGGFFCNGGTGAVGGGGGGGFFCNGDTGTDTSSGTGNGGTGGVLIMYVEEA